MADPTMWMVRAGKGAKFIDDFRDRGIVAIGWNKLGDLAEDLDDQQILRRMDEAYPDRNPGTKVNWTGQLKRFLKEVRPGDDVLSADGKRGEYVLGSVQSATAWFPSEELGRQRRVSWRQKISKSGLSAAANQSLSSDLTVFKVPDHIATEVRERATNLNARQTPPGLTAADFDVLRRNQRTSLWNELPEPDQRAIKALRNKLDELMKYLQKSLVVRIGLQTFVSMQNPAGRNSKNYWACVFPSDVPNKTFGFQLFVIVKPETVEIGFGAGSGEAEMKNEDNLDRLKAVFKVGRDRLAALREQDWMPAIAENAVRAGYQLRRRWLSENPDRPELSSMREWVDHAAGDGGSGAAISRFLSREDVIRLGDDFAELLRKELQLFVPILDAVYGDVPPPPRRLAVAEPDPVPLSPVGSTSSLTIDWLLEETLWDRAQLVEILDALESGTRQLVLAGPPGTSKTWVARSIARYFTRDRANAVRLVQFHPSYSYEEFIEGLRPVASDGTITFQRKDGFVLSVVDDMRTNHGPTVIVIDEMNRANLPKVFGELMYLFEYRDQPLDMQYTRGFRLPRDLFFFGTMNTADRSIRSIDIALRRRFDVFDCPPDPQVLAKFYNRGGRTNDVTDLIDGFNKLNAALAEALDVHHTIGHAFFMLNVMNRERLQHVWRRKIGPLIGEYFFDQPDVAKTFAPSEFWSGV